MTKGQIKNADYPQDTARDELDAFLGSSGISAAAEKRDKLIAYMDKILEANRQVNLTAITERDEFIRKHIMDSLGCVELECFSNACSIIDVGTGGGFPGVPLAVAFPEKKFTLLDSLNKRIRIIEDACENLGITNVRPVHGRAEELARDESLRESFDLCVSRAVANMNTLLELCLPFVKVGGYFLAYKGAGCEEEVDTAAKATEMLGGRLCRIISQPAAAGMERHSIVVIEKVEPTGSAYPRRAGKPAKDPLK